MKHLIVGSIVLALVTLGWGNRSSGEQAPAPQGELRIVDKSSRNFLYVAWNVFEHLIEFDQAGKLVPGLATSWHWLDDRTLDMTLRRGVRFHNGEVFDADIVKLNWDESVQSRQPHMIGNFMNFKSGSRLEIMAPYRVQFMFPEPDGGALAKLSLMHIGNRQFYRDHGWGEKEW
jgi:ABC-type transport system substrate-binding protein